MLKDFFLNNKLGEWGTALAATTLIFLLTRLAKAILLRQLKKLTADSETPWLDIAAKILERVNAVFLMAAALYAGMLFVSLPALLTGIFDKIFMVIVLMQIGLLATQAIRSTFEHYRRQQVEKNAEAVTMLSSVSFLSRMALWVILILVSLDNFGVNITALVAGLGVGGVAVALAVQNILGDIFASFSIVLDKPFVIGDFIIVGDHLGAVEYVGLKTTRIRSLSGEELIFSNQDLLNSRIRNFKRMTERRVVFLIGVLYQTPLEKIKRIPRILQDIIEAQMSIRFDRAHFKEFGPYSLNFEAVYWVKSSDYTLYMDIQQAINIALFEQFAQEGIELAYPTQKLYLTGEIGSDPVWDGSVIQREPQSGNSGR